MGFLQYYEQIEAFRGIPFGVDIFLRLLASILAGSLVGFERKKKAKEAGIRTHCMVALGSAIFAIVSKYGFFDVTNFDSISLDASRIAANIVTGVCFLGAGTIFIKNKSISGLTTAAGIWVVSAIGLAFGSGLFCLGIISTLVVFAIQYVLHKPIIAIEGSSIREITCVIDTWEDFDKLEKAVKEIDKKSYFSSIEKRTEGTVLCKFVIRVEHATVLDNIYTFMQENPYVRSISN